MKLLLISDEVDKYLWDYYRPGRLAGYDLILSAGDLNAEYLSFLVTMANRPLLYVPGNHDGSYAQKPPEGCDCIDGKLVTVNGLRILGLGGSALYNRGPHQYTEAQMQAEWTLCSPTRPCGATGTRTTRPTGALRPSCPCWSAGSPCCWSTDMCTSAMTRWAPGSTPWAAPR